VLAEIARLVLAARTVVSEGESGLPATMSASKARQQRPRRACRPLTGIGCGGDSRDLLRANSRLRDDYGAVKRQLAAATETIDEYGQGKSAMVQRILAAAGLSNKAVASIAANQVPSHDEHPR